MKVLHLTLKRKWFDMILSGEKKEEYRDKKAYWVRRLLCNFCYDKNENPIKLNGGSYCKKEYDVIEFKNGYGSKVPSLTIEYTSLQIGFGKSEWGSNGETFKLGLGKIISTKNINP